VSDCSHMRGSGAEVIAGRVAIVRPLALGNMGQAYEAVDERTGGKIMVKTMLGRRNGELVSLRESGDATTLGPSRFPARLALRQRGPELISSGDPHGA
jgi:hypothetical protein